MLIYDQAKDLVKNCSEGRIEKKVIETIPHSEKSKVSYFTRPKKANQRNFTFFAKGRTKTHMQETQIEVSCVAALSETRNIDSGSRDDEGTMNIGHYDSRLQILSEYDHTSFFL